MQTARHPLFVVLAGLTAGCTPRPTTSAVRAPASACEEESRAAVVPDAIAPTRTATRTRAPARVTPQPGAPGIVHADLSAPQLVTLHFSEPVTRAAEIDPAQFRLSLGSHETDEDYTMTYYYDPGAIEDPKRSARFTEIRVVDEITIQLVLAEALSSATCDEVDAIANDVDRASDGSTGLFLHYYDGDTVGIVDADGQRVADIAPLWAIRKAAVAAYTGPDLPPIEAVGPIPCRL